MKDGFEDFLLRLVELVKDDQELHDATVRLINASADLKLAKAQKISKKVL